MSDVVPQHHRQYQRQRQHDIDLEKAELGVGSGAVWNTENVSVTREYQ